MDPTVRPGCEKGSFSLDGLPHRLPIILRRKIVLVFGFLYQWKGHNLS